MDGGRSVTTGLQQVDITPETRISVAEERRVETKWLLSGAQFADLSSPTIFRPPASLGNGKFLRRRRRRLVYAAAAGSKLLAI